jgi:hypothetical protein
MSGLAPLMTESWACTISSNGEQSQGSSTMMTDHDNGNCLTKPQQQHGFWNICAAAASKGRTTVCWGCATASANCSPCCTVVTVGNKPILRRWVKEDVRQKNLSTTCFVTINCYIWLLHLKRRLILLFRYMIEIWSYIWGTRFSLI